MNKLTLIEFFYIFLKNNAYSDYEKVFYDFNINDISVKH